MELPEFLRGTYGAKAEFKCPRVIVSHFISVLSPYASSSRENYGEAKSNFVYPTTSPESRSINLSLFPPRLGSFSPLSKRMREILF